MSEYHEPLEALPEQARNHHRALKSLMEELEAVDWYHQRHAASKDDALRAILAHHRDEEIEHACMLLEWLRREMPVWDAQLRKYLFSETAISEQESAERSAVSAAPTRGQLQIGGLRGK